MVVVLVVVVVVIIVVIVVIVVLYVLIILITRTFDKIMDCSIFVFFLRSLTCNYQPLVCHLISASWLQHV